ncbi:hypothetical protein CKAH01_04495 [Colletotrichum kahawae]|uniref:Uncharacterized protein n=1 Tax=Colletotrichum kahawae TaxID=34407 RepID=A0AAD9YLL1_COLKA|nr:hypothetical protein CKAH01_04495 [Colletotrichum kahawae]
MGSSENNLRPMGHPRNRHKFPTHANMVPTRRTSCFNPEKAERLLRLNFWVQ